MKDRAKKLLRWLWVWAPLLLLSPGTAYGIDITAGLGNAVSASTLASKIVRIATTVGSLIGAVALGAFIWGAFQLATSGNEQARAQAKQKMVFALAGVALVGFAVLAISFWANLVKSQAQ